MVLKDIINKLQTQNFNRIRIGIGSPPIMKKQKKQTLFLMY